MDEESGRGKAVIRRPDADVPAGSAAKPRAKRLRFESPASAAILVGGAVDCLCPLLVWWTGPAAYSGIPAGSVDGLRQWPGMLCFLAGAVVLATVVYGRRKAGANAGPVARTALVAGLFGVAAAVVAAADASGLVGVPGVIVRPTLAVVAAGAGGVLAAAGGFHQAREGKRG